MDIYKQKWKHASSTREICKQHHIMHDGIGDIQAAKNMQAVKRGYTQAAKRYASSKARSKQQSEIKMRHLPEMHKARL